MDSFGRAVTYKARDCRGYYHKDYSEAGRRFKIHGRHRIEILDTFQYSLHYDRRIVLDAYVIDAYALQLSVPFL